MDKYRADIDGLRAIAVLLVVLFHSGVKTLSGGYVGVDIFFVISGFLIGGIINREVDQQKFSFLNFYKRRIMRIAPALFFMLLVVMALGYALLSPAEYQNLAKYSIAAIVSIPNIAIKNGIDYFNPTATLNPLLMTWSLGVEEQFYIGLPFLFILFKKLGRKPLIPVIVCALASLALCLVLTPMKPQSSYYLLHTRAWELGVGVLLALVKPTPVRGGIANVLNIIALVMIGASAVLLNEKSPFPGYWAMVPVLGAALMIIANGRVNQLVLENPCMRFIGKVSYSWYLWHWPLLSLANLFCDYPITATQGVMISLLALFISYLSWRWVEQPFRHLRTSPSRTVVNYCLTSLALVAVISVVWIGHGLQYRVNATVNAAEQTKVADETNPCLVGYGVDTPNHLQQCMPKSNVAGIALLGDSHAAALRHGIAEYAEQLNKPLFQLNKSSCPFLIGATRAMADHPQQGQECAAFNQKVLAVLQQNKIDQVVITAFWEAGFDTQGSGFIKTGHPELDNLAAFHEGMNQTIQTLKSMGIKVVLIEDVPEMDVDVLRATVNNNIPVRAQINHFLNGWQHKPLFESRTKAMEPYHPQINSILAQYQSPQIKVINLRDNLCDANGCLMSAKGQPLYLDHHHLTRLGNQVALGQDLLPQ